MRNGIAHGGVTYMSDVVPVRRQEGETGIKSIHTASFGDSTIFWTSAMDSFWPFPFSCLPGMTNAMSCRQTCLSTNSERPPEHSIGELSAVFLYLTPNRSQLVVHARLDTLDWRKVQLSLFHSAILLEQLAPGYERYFFSFRSGKSWPGCAAFDGRELARLRMAKSPIEGYGNVLVDKLLFLVPRYRLPRLFAKLGILWLSYKTHRPLIADDLRQKFGRPKVTVRGTAIHRNAWGIVLHAHVVVGREVRDLDQDLIRRICAGIVRKSARVGRAKLSRFNICKYLPLGFCRIHVYRRDHRMRRLLSFGLANDLMCTIQVQRIGRIQSPDLLGSTIETQGRHRIAWNRS